MRPATSKYKQIMNMFQASHNNCHIEYCKNKQMWVIILLRIVRLTVVIYFGLYWNAPKKPKMMKIIWKKLSKIGIHKKPRKSKTCFSIIVSYKEHSIKLVVCSFPLHFTYHLNDTYCQEEVSFRANSHDIWADLFAVFF